MPATAEGVFRVVDAASDPIKKIKTAALEMDKAVGSAGNALDKLDSPKITTSIQTTKKNTEGLTKTTEVMGKTVERNTDKAGRSYEEMAVKITAAIKETQAVLKDFSHQKATAEADVATAKAEAKLRLLKHHLREVSTAQARAELDSLGLSATKATEALVGTAGGGGGGSPGRGGLAAGFAASGGRLLFMVAAIATALPAIAALTGAISAMVGSLALATAGAAAVGGGIIGAAAVGIGAIAAAAIPATKHLGEAKKAQEAYNKSIRQYGADSAQAAQKKKEMDAAFKKTPGGSKEMLGNAHVLSQRWSKASAPAQRDFIGILNEGLKFANDMMDQFGRTANRVMGATKKAVQDFFKIGNTPEVRGIIDALGNTFSQSIGPFMRAFGQFALFMGRVSKAVSPFVIEFFKNLEKWMTGWANAAKNQDAVQKRVGGWIEHTKTWAHLLKSAAKLMAAFFGAGAEKGKSVVESIADQFDRWTKWIHTHPAQMQDFFQRMIDGAGKLVGALGQIAATLSRIADAMMPILNIVSSLTDMLGSAGLLEPLAMLAGGKFLMSKAGKMGGLFGMGGGAAAGGAGGGMAAGAAGAAGMGVMGTAKGMGTLGRGIYGAERAAGAGRLAAAGATGGSMLAGAGGMKGLAMGGVRAAGKVALPLTAALAAWDFASFKGNVGQRTQAALSGATFGLIPQPHTRAEMRDRGRDKAAEFIGGGRKSGAIRGEIGNLQKQLTERNKGLSLGISKLKLSGDSRKQVEAELDALKPVLRAQVKIEQTQKALHGFDRVMLAFEKRWEQSGPKAAKTGLISDIRDQLKGLKRDGDRVLLRSMASWTATMENGSKDQRAIARATKREIVKQYRAMGKDVRVIEGNILDVSASNWQQVYRAITDPLEQARQEGQLAFTDLQKAASDALQNMGFSGKEANKLIHDLEQDTGGKGAKAETKINQKKTSNKSKDLTGGGAFSPLAGGGSRGLRGGGRIPGAGRWDTVGVAPGFMAAPGEVILNQHTEREIDLDLMRAGRSPISQRLAQNRKIHGNDYSARANMGMSSLAQMRGHGEPGGRKRFRLHGGGVDANSSPAGSFSRVPGDPDTTGGRDKVATQIADAVGSWIRKYKIQIGYAHDPGGGHKSPGHNVTGTALDVVPGEGGSWDTLEQGLKWALAHGHSPIYYGTNGIGTALANHGRGNHAHVEWGSTGGAGPGGAPLAGAVAGEVQAPIHIKRRKSKARGVAGLASNQASDLIAAAMEKKINHAIGAGGATTGGGSYTGKLDHNFGEGSKATLSQNQVAKLAESAGLPGVTFAQIARGESGFQPGAVGHDPGGTQGLGLWQITTGFNTDLIKQFGGRAAMFNPWTNAQAAKAIYDRQGIGAWYGTRYMTDPNAHYNAAMGGRVPEWGGWHAKGTEFTAHRPTLIGVGEGGAERVKVSKQADVNAGGHHFQVSIGQITNHEKGDIEEILEREFAAAAASLDRGPHDNQDELG